MKRAFSRKNLWEKAPRPVRALLGLGLRFVPPSFLLGAAFRRQLTFLERAQWWSMDETRAYTMRRLRYICSLAYRSTTFYRQSFDAVGFRPDDLQSPEDMAHLPRIDKSTVLQHGRELLTVDKDAPGVDYVTTGGTSGQPLRFWIGSNRSAIEYAHLISGWGRVGYRLGMPLAVFRGRVVEPDASKLRHEFDPLLRHHFYSNFHMTDEDMERYLTHLESLGPCYLHVYPSSVAAMARYMHRAGIEPPRNIRGIIAESEIVYPDQRAFVEKVFSRRYWSGYGHTEKLVASGECEESDDQHVWPTYGYMELIDEKGQTITTPGQRGEIVGTGFINTVMPFIRYRTGDFATYIDDRCSKCGRNHLLIRDIEGHRTQETLIAVDGSEISITAINMHDDTFDHIRQYQFVQETPGEATLKLVTADGFDDAAQSRITKNLSEKLAGRINLVLEFVEEIPLSPMGKAVYVDQRIATSSAPVA
jgi:phenylacetate-CoA ligase